MVVAMVANAAIPPTIQLGDEFTSVAALDGKTFAIVDKAAEKALFGSNNQNLAFDAYGSAFVTTNSGYTWQLESLAENQDESVHGYYLLHLVAPNGTPIPTSDWEGKYLNSQNKDGWCCFNLGITAKKLGQDIDYGAVWDVQFVEGKGFSLKNIGTGLYKGADGGTANKEEAVYFAFAPVSTTYVPALKALLAEGEAMKKRGATSAEYDAAIAGIDPDKSADALADAQKVEAALSALAKTQTAAGSDFTRAIANFDCAAKDGWTFDKPKGGNGPDHGGDFEYWAGNASNRAEASFDYWQEITGLPNGTYTVSAEMYNSLNNEGGNYTEFKPTVGVYATVGEKTVSKLVDVNSETRVPYETEAIEVTDGKIRIGVKSFEAPMAARWFTVDNFKLTLVEPAKAPAPAEDAWFNEIDFCFRDKASSVATSKERTFAVWGADPDDVTNGCIVATAGKNSNATNAQFWIRGAEFVEPTYIGEDKKQLTAVYDKGGFAAKTGFKVTMRVKADGEYSAGSQTHKAFQHISNDGFGTLNVTKEWQTVSFVCIADDARAGFTDLCFNLAASDADRTFYFDDIQITSGGPEWYVNTRITDKWKENGQDKNKQAEYKSDGYAEIVTVSNANTCDNQVFFQIADAAPNGKLKKNDKITLEFKAMALLDSESTLDKTEIQAGGGYHRSYDGAGWMAGVDGATIKVGDWADVKREITLDRDGVTNFSLDLSYDSKPITYRFKDVKVTYESGIEEWTEAIKFGVKVTPFTQDPADETKWVAGDDVVNDPAYKVVDGDGMFEVVVDGKKANAWDTQFFFQIADAAPSKALKMNDKVTLKYKIKAVSETLEEGTELSLGGNLHTACGSGWFAGAPAGKAVIGKWTDIEQLFEIGDPKTTNYSMNMSADANPITYYIDEVSVKFEAAPVLDWVELIPNGDCETAAEHAFAAAKEVPVDGSNVNKARIVDGVGKDGGKGIEVVAGAKESQPWDNQFWIYEPYYLPAGTSIIVEFDYKADLAGSVGTQSHREPAAGNNYLHYIGIGNVSFTTEWQHFKYEGKIQNECDGKDDDGNAVARFLSFAFNLNDIADANKYYFDNLSFKVPADVISGKEPIYDVDTYKEVEYKDPNTLDWSENILKNGDLKSDDMREFILKNNDVENPEMLLAEKNEYGEIGIETAALPAEGGNDYDAQFFVRLPKVLPKGKKFNLEFDLYAEHINTLTIAAHGEPGEWKANISSVKTDPSLDAVHYQEYLTAPADMRTIAFNLAVADATTYGFSNIKVQVVNDDMAAIKAATDAADATSLWAETLALNEACYAGRTTETEGKNYTEESVKALEDAIAAGKAELKKNAAEVTAESLTAATKAIKDAINGLTKGDQLLPAPETDPDYANFVEIPLDQQDVENGDVHLAPKEDKGSYTQFTTTDGICVVFKMKDIDVTDCDYITIKFAKPAPAGQSYAVWTGNDNKGIDEGVSEIKYVFAEDPNCKIQNGILPEVSIISIFTGAGKDVSVYGVYKHKAAPALAYTDLTKEMFFVWSDWTDADATAQAGCAYEVGTSSDMPYGDGSVINYADLSEYATLEVTTTEGAPRFLFNRDVKDGQWNENEADSHLIDNTKGGWSAKYFTSKDNGDGSTTYIVDIAALVADKGYAHLHSIKGANWAKTTVTDMKLGYVGEKPALPIPVAINGIAEGASVKDGKYFVNGQIVIVKGGKKFNAAGVEIK